MWSNIIFFLAGALLTAVPLILDWRSKTTGYRSFLIISITALLAVGTFKTIDDVNTQNHSIDTVDNLKNANVRLIKSDSLLQIKADTLKAGQIKLIGELKKIGIDVKNNRPVVVQKNFYNKIEKVNRLDQY